MIHINSNTKTYKKTTKNKKGYFRTDEEQLGVSYDELEWAMNNVENEKINLSKKQKHILSTYKKFRNSK